MKTITHEQAQSIIDIACSNWKKRLAKVWAFNIALKTTIEISDDFYKEMRKACIPDQNKLFDEIFGKDKKNVIDCKVDDWIVVIKGITSDSKRFEGQCLQVTRVISICIVVEGYKSGLHNGENSTAEFRLATPEEIKKVTCLPEGTPCLVSEEKTSWILRYADGNGKFFINGKKSERTSSWEYHHQLNPSVLEGLPE